MYHITHALRRHFAPAPAAVVLLALCLLAGGVLAANGPMDTSAPADANATIEPTPLLAPAASALAPFPGTHLVPGLIEPEDFDAGGEGVAYHDTEPANLGGAYRPTEGVDIETVQGFTNVGWIRSGEWLTYTVTATTPQTVVLWLRFSNPDATSKRVTISTNGTVAGTVDLRSTGSFDMYTDCSSTPFPLPAGETPVRLSFDGVERINLDLLNFALPPTPEPTPIPPPEPELRISTPGLHTLDRDLMANSSIGVLITSSNVVLDGMGHTLEGTDADVSTGVLVGGISPDPRVVNVTVRNLTVHHWETGIWVMRANGTVIEHVVAGQNGIGLRHGGPEFFPSENGVVRDSGFRDNTGIGIDLGYPSGTIAVERCRVTGNRGGMVVAAGPGTYDTYRGAPSLVADCDISGNQDYGLVIQENGYLFRHGLVSAVRNCTISRNGGDGVEVTRSTTTIVGNRVEENGGYGVNAGESGGSDITSNRITGNAHGVSAGGDWPSRVRDNLLNNTDNGNFGTSPDSGYLNYTRTLGPNIVGGPYLGGNYWAFPNGTGFSQTHPDTDGDGFCDDTFVTPQGAVDYLPLAMPAVAAVPGGTGRPTSTAGNGLYDDVNGNGRADFADVVLFFNQMNWIAANEPVSAFDYNDNGRIDFADVVWLFNRLGGAPAPASVFPTIDEPEPGLYRFSAAEVQAIRTATPYEWAQRTWGAGGPWTIVDPMQILGMYPLLRLRDGFVLRAYITSDMMGANGIVFVLPAGQALPPGSGLPSGADLNFTEYIEVDGSPASYLEAVVCSIELRSFAEFWHDVDWRAKAFLDAKPGVRLTYTGPEPAIWSPTVRVGPSETRVVFHTLSSRYGLLEEYTVRFTPGSPRWEWSSTSLAFGGPTYTP